MYSGANGSLYRTFTSILPNERLGFDAFAIDDLNGDGITDYVLSGMVDPLVDGGIVGRVYVVPGVAQQ